MPRWHARPQPEHVRVIASPTRFSLTFGGLGLGEAVRLRLGR